MKNAAVLSPGDRITWGDRCALFLDEMGPKEDSAETLSTRCLDILKDLAGDLGNERGLRTALDKALAALSETAGAEVGFLVSETDSGSAWQLLASYGAPSASSPGRRGLVSNTIVNDAIRKRRPVYLESLIGHPWAREASILSARVFSIACLPLVAGDRVLGCVYLYTQTPGRHIRKSALDGLNVLATQCALILVLKNQLERAERENARLKARATSSEELFVPAESEGPMSELLKRIEKLAPSDLSLLVLGETGVGKERVAREIHRRSLRANGPFVALNCGGLPATLIESILFGHVKGAFTGAERDSTGKIAQADGGTLFLDEIGDLPLELQVKLLRVLQDKRVEPVGGSLSVAVDFRVVAATHQSLESAVRGGKFRQDLYYRLNGATLGVPPLRDRGATEILALADYFLKRTGLPLAFSEDARRKLASHAWPGNVRELEQVVARAAALSPSNEISASDIELGSLESSASASPRFDGLSDALELKDAQLAFTRGYVERTLSRCDGSRARAAHALGISERTLYRILSDASDSPV